MAVTSPRWTDELELLEAARAGDEDAFGRIVADHRAELFAHCYRMLGSTEDAEDVLQEVLVRAWRGLRKFAGQSSLRTWLYRIATNACLDAIDRRPKRMLPLDYGPASESTDDFGPPLIETVWIEPFPDEELGLPEGYASPDARYEQHEAVELAFIAALQHLPATQRAVLVLREVLGFSAREVSESLETTVASVNSALQRARKTLEQRLPDRSQQQTLRSLGHGRIRELVESYNDAWRRGDVEALRALLTEEAVFSMPPWADWWRGRDTIAGFAATAAEACGDMRLILMRANGQAAVAAYSLEEATGRWLPLAMDVLTFEGERISEITAFITPNFFPRFGLPTELAPLPSST